MKIHYGYTSVETNHHLTYTTLRNAVHESGVIRPADF